MPDHSNELTRETEDRIGQFIFHASQSDEVEFFNRQLQNKGPIELNNGGVYMGQWNVDNGHREGQGIMHWIDGSKYIG